MNTGETNWTLGAIARRFALDLHGEDRPVSGVCGLDDDESDRLSFVGSENLLDVAAASSIPAFVTPRGMPVPGKTSLFAEDPELSIAAIAELFVAEPAHQDEDVHPAAVVAADAEIGPGCRIGARAVIGAGCAIGPGSRIHAGTVVHDRVRIGRDCVLHSNVVVREDCRLGDRVIVQPGAVIGGDGYGYVTRGHRHRKIPQLGGVDIGDDVEIGANTTIDRGRFSATRIGRGTKIDNLVMIGHNCRIGEDCLIVSQVGISGSTEVGDRVVLAGQVGVGGHLSIAADVTVLGMGMVAGDIREPGVYAGHPVRPAALWRRAVARFYREARRRH